VGPHPSRCFAAIHLLPLRGRRAITLVLVTNGLALPPLAGEGGAPRERRDGWGLQRLWNGPYPLFSPSVVCAVIPTEAAGREPGPRWIFCVHAEAGSRITRFARVRDDGKNVEMKLSVIPAVTRAQSRKRLVARVRAGTPMPLCSRGKAGYAGTVGAGFERIRFHAPTMMSQMFTAHHVRLRLPLIVH